MATIVKIIFVALLVLILFTQYCLLVISSDNEEDDRQVEEWIRKHNKR